MVRHHNTANRFPAEDQNRLGHDRWGVKTTQGLAAYVALRADVLDHHADFVAVGSKYYPQRSAVSRRRPGRTFEPYNVAEPVLVGLVAKLSEDLRHQVLDLVFKTRNAFGIAHPR